MRAKAWITVLAALAVAASAAWAQKKSAAKDAAAAPKQFVVKAPAGDYLALLTPGGGAPKAFTETVALPLPADAKKAQLLIVNQKTGYAARKSLSLGKGTTNVALKSDDFTLVHRLRVKVTGAGDKPVARAAVTVTDAKGGTATKQIEDASGGVVEFADVPRGEGTVTVIPDVGSETSQKRSFELAAGETALSITMALPEVKSVVEGSEPAAAPPAPTPPAAPPAAQPTAPPAAAPAAPPAPAKAPPSGLMRLFIGLLNLIVLAAIVFGVYLLAKKQGWTVEKAVKALGIQPDTPLGAPSGPSAPVSPGVAPPPPPVVEDPNRCQFCGEVKDAAGNCACTVAPGQAAPATAAAPLGGVSREGPRLIGVAGAYMGHIFPLAGEATIGRDVSNAVPLDQDSSVSRSHAVITPMNGGYLLRDAGSSNGTLVNGVRVTETQLNPGDEVGIGGTRFRFEA